MSSSAPARRPEGSGRAQHLLSLLPALACATCPVCLSVFAGVLSAAGFGALLDERVHLLVLSVACTLALGAHGFMAWRTRRFLPLAVAVAGTLALVGGCLGELEPLELSGLGLLMLASVLSWRESRRAAQAHVPALVPLRISAGSRTAP